MSDRARTLGGYQLWGDIWIRSGWRVQRRASDGACRLIDPSNCLAAAGDEAACRAAALLLAPAPSDATEAVILLHGMGRTRGMMRRLGEALSASGYAVANLGYPSLRASLPDHAALVRSVAEGLAADGATTIHVVGHSLGGLVAREAMACPAPEGFRWGRLVTMGTPHRGAALADALAHLGLYRAVAGGCGQSVTTRAAASLPVPAGIEIGAVAGGTGGARGMNPFLPGDNDMVVKVSEARPPSGEADFLLLRRASHSFIPSRPDAIAAALSFIATGRLAAGPSCRPVRLTS